MHARIASSPKAGAWRMPRAPWADPHAPRTGAAVRAVRAARWSRRRGPVGAHTDAARPVRRQAARRRAGAAVLMLWPAVQADGAAAALCRVLPASMKSGTRSRAVTNRSRSRGPRAGVAVSPLQDRSDFDGVRARRNLRTSKRSPTGAWPGSGRSGTLRAEPIEFMERGGRLILYDGNHRLTLFLVGWRSPDGNAATPASRH